MANEPRPTHEFALEDLRWLRALAGRLVRDPGRADDAVQDTLMRSLRHRPRDPGALRAWLAMVLRNALRQDARGRARRERREGARPAPGEAPATLDVVAELALHRRLLEHVNALEEPYRTAIVLRFLRERSPREAARELGVPLKTFHTRVERALVALRARLGRERETWALVLALDPRPLAPLAGGLTPLWLPMKLKSIAAVLGLLLVSAWWRWPRAERAARADVAAEPVALAEPSRSGAAQLPWWRNVREPAAGSEAAPAAPTFEPAPAETLRGSVRALDGTGLPGLRVRFVREVEKVFPRSPDDPFASSGPRGEFSLPRPEHPGRLTLEDDTLAALIQPRIGVARSGASAPEPDPIVVAVPARDHDGRVLDEHGRGVAGATLELTLPGSFLQSIDVGDVTLHLLLPLAETRTDETGAFRFTRVAAPPGAFLEARAEGYVAGEVALPEASSTGLELVLRRAPDGPRVLHGCVLDVAGLPAGGAQVSVGDSAVSTDGHGRFALECSLHRRRGTLRAVKPGALPAELVLDPLPFDGVRRLGTPEAPLVLQLGAAPLALRGRVLDAEGHPVAGALVFSPDTTPFGAVEHHEGTHSFLGGTTVEALLAGQSGPEQAQLQAETDGEGRFELAGLLDRSYALFALAPRTLAGSGRVDVRPGGPEVRLVLRSAPRHALAGRVLSRAGTPLEGVSVTLGRAFPWRSEEEAAAVEWAQLPRLGTDAAWVLGEPSAHTDADGRFALAPLEVEGAFLVLRGRAIPLSERVALHPGDDLGALEIRVDASTRFELVLARATEADAFSLETPGGEPLALYVEVDGAVISAGSVDLVAGRSGPVLAREGDWVVVLHSGGAEVRRQRLHFPAGGLHELQP